MNLSISLHGIFPHSTVLAKAWQEYERGRCAISVPLQAEAELFQSYLALQKELHFSPLTSPMLNWLDYFRPFTEIVANLTAGPLVRFPRTNTFYRAPVRTGSLALKRNSLNQWIRSYVEVPVTEPYKVIFPSPFYFASSIQDESHHPLDFLISECSYLLGEILQALTSLQNCVLIQFQEPFLGNVAANSILLKSLQKGFQEMAQTTSLPIILHTYFTPILSWLPRLLEFPVFGLGLDACHQTSDEISCIPYNGKMRLLLGILDVHSTRVERLDWLTGYLTKLISHWKPTELTLSVNGDPQFLPHDVFLKKVQILKEVKEKF